MVQPKPDGPPERPGAGVPPAAEARLGRSEAASVRRSVFWFKTQLKLEAGNPGGWERAGRPCHTSGIRL